MKSQAHQFFCIFSLGRSGSHLLQSLLGSHPHIHCHGEVFHPRQIAGKNYSFLVNSIPIWKILRKVFPQILLNKAIETLYDKTCARMGKSNLGFLLWYRDIKNYPEIMPWLKQRRSKIIHLVRKNQLKSLVSRKIALKTGVWHATQPASWQPVELEVQKVVPELRQRYLQINSFRAQCFSLPYLEVTYESLVSNQQYEMARILDFLGESKEYPLQSNLVKIVPDALDKIIKNYEEVSAVLKGTEFDSLLERNSLAEKIHQ